MRGAEGGRNDTKPLKAKISETKRVEAYACLQWASRGQTGDGFNAGGLHAKGYIERKAKIPEREQQTNTPTCQERQTRIKPRPKRRQRDKTKGRKEG